MPIPVPIRPEAVSAGRGNRIISRARVEANGVDIKDGISGDAPGTARTQINVV
ncbi:hypothetical protein [Thiohalophilus thiocyanatoxydans]|uniref:Uncharacterized protein n=1 Tax=Thiohalophilus thiocyanatoxydans TaxID=381308 RepID=A0A4R8J0S3_9GAMM|nr:hypothetical protein [Thiohalophilus thiocyanatoxydans]TDY03897.1 hypothetical protein EDC23_0268 [Thiohalophilus thiocyanatoxydans]